VSGESASGSGSVQGGKEMADDFSSSRLVFSIKRLLSLIAIARRVSIASGYMAASRRELHGGSRSATAFYTPLCHLFIRLTR
jgi:hypothetical protein